MGMKKYRKKPVVIEAEQWFKVSDYVEGPPRIVDYYRTPECDGQNTCEHCGRIMHDHGYMDTLEGGHTVCPGDWIIRGIKGEFYPCKPDIFEATYEAFEATYEAKEYGEPWNEATFMIEEIGEHIYGEFIEKCEGRAIRCVNLLAGIPDEDLPNVLKAYVSYHTKDEEATVMGRDFNIEYKKHNGGVDKWPELALLGNLKEL